MNWLELNNQEQLASIDEQSTNEPVLIFKHSTRCSISAAALNRLERKWNEALVGNLKTYFLDLISHRSLSNDISSKYGVIHQSPQVIIIKGGKSVYDNSHLGISFDEILEIISEANLA